MLAVFIIVTTQLFAVIVCLHGFLGDSDDWVCVECLSDYQFLHRSSRAWPSKSMHCVDFKSCCDRLSCVLSHQVPEQAPIVLVDTQWGPNRDDRVAKEYFSAFNIKLLICESGHFGLDDEEHKKQRLINDRVWANRFSHETIKPSLKTGINKLFFNR